MNRWIGIALKITTLLCISREWMWHSFADGKFFLEIVVIFLLGNSSRGVLESVELKLAPTVGCSENSEEKRFNNYLVRYAWENLFIKIIFCELIQFEKWFHFLFQGMYLIEGNFFQGFTEKFYQ